MKFHKLLLPISLVVNAVLILGLMLDPNGRLRQPIFNHPDDEFDSRLSGSNLNESNGYIDRKLETDQIAEKSPKTFGNLSPQEKYANLSSRISRIQQDLENSRDPKNLVKAIFSDIGSLDGFVKKSIAGSLETQLAELDAESGRNLDGLASIYPLIQAELRANKIGRRTSEDHMFSCLAINMQRLGVDPSAEIMKINDSGVRESFLIGVIPNMMIANSDSYDEAISKLPPEIQGDIYQNVMRLSTIDQVYQNQALKFYVEGLGRPGAQSDLVDKWFNDSAWFWKNVNEIAEVTSASAPSERRDAVIQRIIRSSNNNPEVANKWISLIQNQKLAEKISEEISRASVSIKK